jgi:hypothetical protein
MLTVPYGATVAGSRNTPPPMMLSVTRHTAVSKPNLRRAGCSTGLRPDCGAAVFDDLLTLPGW